MWNNFDSPRNASAVKQPQSQSAHAKPGFALNYHAKAHNHFKRKNELSSQGLAEER
jgi:hypothetical protein